MKDIRSNLELVKTINPAAYTSDQTGAGVDLSGFNGAMAIVQVGAITDGTHTPKLQESDDNSTFTDVVAADLQAGTGAVGLAVATANTTQTVGYKGAMRYIRVYVTSSGATGAIYGAQILKGYPAIAPTA